MVQRVISNGIALSFIIISVHASGLRFTWYWLYIYNSIIQSSNSWQSDQLICHWSVRAFTLIHFPVFPQFHFLSRFLTTCVIINWVLKSPLLGSWPFHQMLWNQLSQSYQWSLESKQSILIITMISWVPESPSSSSSQWLSPQSNQRFLTSASSCSRGAEKREIIVFWYLAEQGNCCFLIFKSECEIYLWWERHSRGNVLSVPASRV